VHHDSWMASRWPPPGGPSSSGPAPSGAPIGILSVPGDILRGLLSPLAR
jgi:hypothetical protein